MLYSVKYKRAGQLFFRTLTNVKGDGIVEGGVGSRYFILSNEERVEIPSSCIFIFSKERFLLIKSNIDAAIGQNIPVNHG